MPQLADVASIVHPSALQLPKTPRVLDVKVEPHVDSTGDDSLRITVILDNKTTDAQRSLKKIEPIENAMREALERAGVELFPYFWFRTRAEYNGERRRR